jgi:YjbR protein
MMLRASDFRRIVLGMDGASEGAHMGHPDFRGHGRIFATLNAEETRGVVMLTPEQQQTFLSDHPAMFEAGPGAWGRSGSTWIVLDAADEDTVGEAVTLAWQNAAATAAARRKPAASARKKTAVRARRSTSSARRKARR